MDFFFLFLRQNDQDDPGASSSSYSARIHDPSLEVKMPEPEADHSLTSCVEVRNEWSYISAQPIHLCLHGARREYFLLNLEYISSVLFDSAQEDPIFL